MGYTLTYTDLYGSKWTTRPLRVRKSEVYTATNDLYTWTQASKQLTFQHTGGDFTGFSASRRPPTPLPQLCSTPVQTLIKLRPVHQVLLPLVTPVTVRAHEGGI